MADPAHILIVCTGNSCRSPMAEGFLKKLLQAETRVAISSAGTHAWPRSTATPEAVAAARERGIDISGHSARRLDDKLAGQADLIITMTTEQALWLHDQFPAAREKIATLGELARQKSGLDIADPVGGPLAVYRKVAGDLEALLGEAVPMIKKKLHLQ